MLLLAIDVATIVCAVLLGVRVLASRPRSTAAQLIALITVCNVCNIVLARYEYGYWIPAPFRIDVDGWRPLLNLARNLTPGLFMVLSHAQFSERRRFPRWLLALFVVQVFLEEPLSRMLPDPRWIGPSQLVAAGLQMLFAGAAIYWAVASWRSDLVETRRRIRALTVFIIGLDVIGTSLLLRVVVPQNTVANYLAYVAFLVINLAILAVLLLRISGQDVARYLEPERPPRSPALRPSGALDPQSAVALATLSSLLETDHVYRQPGLSLNDLARRVSLPEYRLRRLIHEELGYKNFNLFLHDHRIREACAQLRDPAMRRIPILTIALSVGYQSINTFNRGFGEIMGMTPSAYRAQDAVASVAPPDEITPKTP